MERSKFVPSHLHSYLLSPPCEEQTTGASSFLDIMYSFNPNLSIVIKSFLVVFFSILRNDYSILRKDIRCRFVSLDFETGSIAVFKNFVSNDNNQLILEGCNFHFAQCLHRKLASPEIGLAGVYNQEDTGIEAVVKKLIALSTESFPHSCSYFTSTT